MLGLDSGPRRSVTGILRRHGAVRVGDAEGFRHARYALGGLREEIKQVCLLWPLHDNRVNSSFGRRWGRRHHGVDLKARIGTPVLAALPGKAIYAGGEIRGYGRIVILKHARGLATVYAHNSEFRVQAGQFVEQGQVIALSGASGRVSGPHLHFEVRDHGKALNPARLLIASVRSPSEASRLCRRSR